MKNNQTNLLILNQTPKELILSIKQDDKNKKKIQPTAKEPEQEGSLQTIEKPQEHNDNTILKTEAQIEEADNNKDALSFDSAPSDAQLKRGARIPFGFFSHVQENRAKYIY